MRVLRGLTTWLAHVRVTERVVIALVICAALVFHAIFPRYEWHAGYYTATWARYDRWTGRVVVFKYPSRAIAQP